MGQVPDLPSAMEPPPQCPLGRAIRRERVKYKTMDRTDDPSLIETVAHPSALSGISSTSSADEGRFIETFLTDSWLEHLRQHRRVTKADRISEQAVRRFQIGDGPKTTHLISAQGN